MKQAPLKQTEKRMKHAMKHPHSDERIRTIVRHRPTDYLRASARDDQPTTRRERAAILQELARRSTLSG